MVVSIVQNIVQKNKVQSRNDYRNVRCRYPKKKNVTDMPVIKRFLLVYVDRVKCKICTAKCARVVIDVI